MILRPSELPDCVLQPCCHKLVTLNRLKLCRVVNPTSVRVATYKLTTPRMSMEHSASTALPVAPTLKDPAQKLNPCVLYLVVCMLAPVSLIHKSGCLRHSSEYGIDRSNSAHKSSVLPVQVFVSSKSSDKSAERSDTSSDSTRSLTTCEGENMHGSRPEARYESDRLPDKPDRLPDSTGAYIASR
jgi:hypothetical protein